MIQSDERKCLLWLSCAEISSFRVQELIRDYHSIGEIWEGFGKKGGPVFNEVEKKTLTALHAKTAMDDLCARLEKKKVRLLFQDDPEYPPQLKDIPDPPYLLYYAGHLQCLERPIVGVVGTRRASSAGIQMAESLGKELCKAGACVVSGLAHGIDSAAHRGALSVNGETIGVLGSGINVPYPADHTPMLRQIAGGIGLILSEYPLDARPAGYHFPYRNRIISGLSMGIVFVEGAIKSGGMHTVNVALVQGREVFAVPGQIGKSGSEGPHAILREGARIITCAQDLLDDLGLAMKEPSAQAEEEQDLSERQRRIIEALKVQNLSIEELSTAISESTDALISELGILEILGRVTREAGNRFALPISSGR